MHTTRADTSERRFEIQCKLESEIAALEALKEAEERSRRLTSGVVGILSSLEDRLATLRRTILPVYNETENLQAQQHSKHFIISQIPSSLKNFVIHSFSLLYYRYREDFKRTGSCYWILRCMSRGRSCSTCRTKWTRWFRWLSRGHESTVQRSAVLPEKQS